MRTDAKPELRAVVERRLATTDPGRWAHVEAVVATIDTIATDAGWPPAVIAAARRAGWYHDALKGDPPEAWRARIRAAGEALDPWSSRHRPELLHAPAAAVWATERGEADPDVLAAVRHHPTAHPEWGAIGWLLYVADFCEPGRAHAAEVGAAELCAEASGGDAALARVARRVLGLRLGDMLLRARPIHPLAWRTWNAWTGAA